MIPANRIWFIGLIFFLLSGTTGVKAEDKPSVSISLEYVNFNGKLPYINVNTKARIERRWHPAPGVEVKVYLNNLEDKSVVGTVTTDEKGRGTIILQKGLKEKWDSSLFHTFYAFSSENEQFSEGETDLTIEKARLVVDTLNEDGLRSVAVSLQVLTESGWKNVQEETEVKIGIKRMGGFLSIAAMGGSFYTDEQGMALAEYELTDLPGDESGNVVLIVKLEEHSLYGTLINELQVPWGKPFVSDNSAFKKRSLWGTWNKTPIWLLITANGILLAVWGVIVYLIVQLFRMVKLGKSKA